MTKLVIITLVSLAVTIAIVIFPKNSPPDALSTQSSSMTKTPEQHRRTPDQTFLTYPEWFLVYSPEEFASFTKDHPAHQFPFFGHLRQFWSAYGTVNKYITSRYPFNFGYHVMVMVIGTSTSVEYILRACYENVIGRLSYATTGGKFTTEDEYAAIVAREYVDFIKVQPWYEFDFLRKLRELWKNTPATGSNMIRKWERRYVLSSEYTVKAIYAWIIKKATQASYEAPIPTTAVMLDRKIDPTDLSNDVKPAAGSDGELVMLPRYDAFKNEALRLAKAGYHFREIAGNTDVIFVTWLAPSSWQNPAGISKILFEQTILTNPSRKRVAVIVPIQELSSYLAANAEGNIVLEHIYDF